MTLLRTDTPLSRGLSPAPRSHLHQQHVERERTDLSVLHNHPSRSRPRLPAAADLGCGGRRTTAKGRAWKAWRGATRSVRQRAAGSERAAGGKVDRRTAGPAARAQKGWWAQAATLGAGAGRSGGGSDRAGRTNAAVNNKCQPWKPLTRALRKKPTRTGALCFQPSTHTSNAAHSDPLPPPPRRRLPPREPHKPGRVLATLTPRGRAHAAAQRPRAKCTTLSSCTALNTRARAGRVQNASRAAEDRRRAALALQPAAAAQARGDRARPSERERARSGACSRRARAARARHS